MESSKELVFCFIEDTSDTQSRIDIDCYDITIILELEEESDDVLTFNFPFKVSEGYFKNVIRFSPESDIDPLTKKTIEALKELESIEEFSLRRCSVEVVKGKAFDIVKVVTEVISKMINLQ